MAGVCLGNRPTSATPSAQNQLSGEKKVANTTMVILIFTTTPPPHILMIHLVFYTAFHCLVLSAVTCKVSVGYNFCK